MVFHVLLISIDVEFAFTEDDFRANEPDSSNPATFLPVLVSKSARIASRVELVVVPLTVQEANATRLPLPPNIPANDPRSPPFASKKSEYASACYYDISSMVQIWLTLTTLTSPLSLSLMRVQRSMN
jgi:hypothetical protein